MASTYREVHRALRLIHDETEEAARAVPGRSRVPVDLAEQSRALLDQIKNVSVGLRCYHSMLRSYRDLNFSA